MHLKKLSCLILKSVRRYFRMHLHLYIFKKLTYLSSFKSTAKLEANADFYWDKFYKFHANRFFNDRHWFSAEFPALLTAKAVLEVGCGVGNTIFPLLEINPTAHVYACDFAATAINIVHQHPVYETSDRVTAFVANLIHDDMLKNVPRGIVDACTMIFVLSAISPEAMPTAVANVKQTLLRQPGGSTGSGQILFRDYAAGDLAQERLQRDYKQQRIGEGFYMRGDGTRAYYFTEDFVLDLFKQQGFRCDSLLMKDMVKVNRSTGVKMGRKFLHGVFTLIEEEGKDGGDDGESSGEKAAWSPFKSSKQEESLAVRPQSRENEDEAEEIGRIENELEVIELGNGNKMAMTLKIESYDHHHCSQQQNSCASKILAEVVLRCPELFHDINLVQIRCGGRGGNNNNCSGDGMSGTSSISFEGLPLLAALRWCRRALAIDHRREALEIFRRNAIRNGWQFAYEKLRVAIEPPRSSVSGDGGSEESSWAAAAFQGPIGCALACIDSQDFLITVQEVLNSTARILPKGKGGFLLLIGPKEIFKSSHEGSGDGGVVAMAAQGGFELASESPAELVKAIQDVDLAGNSVMLFSV
jgi:SAM-dependent methyltransferase